MTHLTVVVLTYNEELHIGRCLRSLKAVADKIIVVDSGSNDNTVAIAKSFNAEVLSNSWVSHGSQFNWTIDQLSKETDWIIRIDADEHLSDKLISDIKKLTPNLNPNINGIYFKRYIKFQNSLIRYGGIGGVESLRMFRYGFGRSETKLQDEHIVVSGKTTTYSGKLLDENMQSLRWWIDKHNKYSSNEAYDVLYKKYIDNGKDGAQNFMLKRWCKENLYYYMPKGIRAFAYFFYRYVFLFGFLDGLSGLKFHFFQACWYRFLVDSKIEEVENLMHNEGMKFSEAVSNKLAID